MKYLKFDNNNFKPLFVDWAITNKCYLSCTHCRYRGQAKNTTEAQKQNSKVKSQKSKVELELNETFELATEINTVNPNWVLIEGGEPFLREDIFSILEIIKNKPRMNPALPKITRMNETTPIHSKLERKGGVNTNKHEFNKERNPLNPSNRWLQEKPVYIISSGMGFKETYAEKCRDLGIKLMISLDSGVKQTYERIRKGASFSNMIKAIKIANEFNILDSINVTLQELNASTSEIETIGKLADEFEIQSINFLGFKPNQNILVNSEQRTLLPATFSKILNIQEKHNLKVLVDEPFFRPWVKEARVKTQVESTLHGSRDPIREARNKKKENKGPIVVEDKIGCIFGEYIFIEPDGTTKPCSFSPLSFNEIGKETLQKIQDKRNRKSKCGKCEYVLQCGGCRVRTYVMTGDWFESDPFCPL